LTRQIQTSVVFDTVLENDAGDVLRLLKHYIPQGDVLLLCFSKLSLNGATMNSAKQVIKSTQKQKK